VRGSAIITVLLLTLLAAASPGCAIVPMADPDADADAKRFVPTPGSASVYVVRPNQFVGTACVLQISLDGVLLGEVAPGTYLVSLADPGSHTVAASEPRGWFEGDLEIDAAAGGACFVKVTVTSTAMSELGLKLEPLSDSDGRQEVLANKRAQSLSDG